MKFSINTFILAILILQLVLSAAMQEAALIPIRVPGGELRNILVVATGGTIAGWAALSAQVVGYEPGHFLIKDVLRSIANLSTVANVSSIQMANMDSDDMASPVVLNITRLVQSGIDNDWIHGVVVTHGTDTLEETAFFLSSVIDSEKPVVIVGSMRPHTALSADGPLNLFEAITLAAAPEAEGRGVMVVLNDRIASAHYVTKTHANSVDTFHAVEQGYLGYFDNTIPKFYFAPARPIGWHYFNVTGLTNLPRVDIHYGHQGLNPALVNTSVETGAEGIVLAGMGAGGWSQVGSKVLHNLVDTHGTMVVASHRTQDGTVSYVKDWVIGSGLLNAQKSRILLQLAINAGYSFNETKAMFEL